MTDGRQYQAVSLREQAIEAIQAWEGLYEREKQRAQRAEAECERLRRSLQNVMVHTGHTKTSPDRLHMELLDHIAQIASNALATPPPESDQDRDEIENGQHPEPIEYEQPGDALAALDRVRVRGHAIVTTQEDTDSWLGDIETIRRHLTASGVPEYRPIETAPEGVRVLLKAGIDNPPVVGTVTHYEENGPVSTVLHYNGDRLVGAFHATHWRPLDSGVPYVPEDRDE